LVWPEGDVEDDFEANGFVWPPLVVALGELLFVGESDDDHDENGFVILDGIF